MDSKEETKGKLCKPETSLHKHLPSELAEVFPNFVRHFCQLWRT